MVSTVAEAIRLDLHARIAKAVIALYKEHQFYISADQSRWSHTPWNLSNDENNQGDWEGFSHENQLDPDDDSLRTLFFNAVADTNAYFINLIATIPNWSPIETNEDVSSADQVSDESEDPQ